MSAGAPWSVKGIDPKAREIAKDLARRSGMTLGEWLNQIILEDPDEDSVVTPLSRRAAPDPDRRARLRRVEDTESEAGFERVSRALEGLTARIEAAERRSSQAISGVDQAVAGLLTRLETSETGQAGAAQRFEHIAAGLRAEHSRLAERLRRVEAESVGPRSVEALRALETAMGKLASQMVESDARTREEFAAIGRRVEGLESAPDGTGIIVDGLVARIAARLEEAEARTSSAIRALEGTFSHLDERLGRAEHRLGADRETRFEKLAEDLSSRVEKARSDLLSQLDAAAGGRLDRIERALGDLGGQVEIAEKRSAEAIEHMGREVVRIARNLDTRMSGVEQAAARGVAETRNELGRVAAAVEHRFQSAETSHAQALERLGQEIGKISEKMSERIAAAERRAAIAAEEAGERLNRTADALETRWDRASGELADRIRASEERTAKLLDEAREKIDRTLARAEAAPTPPAPLPEPAPEAVAELDSLFEDPAPAFGHRPAETPAPTPEAAPSPKHAWVAPQAAPVASLGDEDDLQAGDDDFQADTEFVSEEDLAERQPLTTREALEAARAAARLGVRQPIGDERNFGFALGGLKLGAKTRLHERVARESKRDASVVKTAALSTAFAVTLTSAVVGYKLIWADASRGPSPAKKPTTPLKINEPDETPLAATVMTTQSSPTGQVSNAPQPTPAQSAAGQIAADPMFDASAQNTAAQAKMLANDAPTTRPAASAKAAGGAAELYETAKQKLAAQDPGGVALLTRAAAMGYPPAEFHLGKLYENGESGVGKDPAQARRWTERAAAAGERRAMHNLALFYFDGVGGPKDLIQAAVWFRKASDLGLVDSQYNLGRLYEQGFGVQRDLIQAYKWYLIAGKAGDNESRSAAEQLKPGLPQQDLKEAERAAAAFHPGHEGVGRLAGR